MTSWLHGREGRLPSVVARTGPGLTAGSPILSMLGFPWLVYEITGHPFRWTQLHAAWGREYQSIASLATGYYERVLNEGVYGYTASAPIDALNLVAAIFALAAVGPVWRRFGLPWAALLAATVIPPLSMGGVLSRGRITSTAIPAFLWLALVLPSGTRRNVQYAFMALQGLAAALFFTWRPLF